MSLRKQFKPNNTIDKFYEECAINNFFEKSQTKASLTENFQTATQKIQSQSKFQSQPFSFKENSQKAQSQNKENRQFQLLPVPKALKTAIASSQKKTNLRRSLKLIMGRIQFIKKFRDERSPDRRIYETYGKIVRITKDKLKITLFLRDLAGGPVVQFDCYDPEILNQEFEPNELVKIVGDLFVGSNLQFIKIWKITNYPTKFDFEKLENKVY